MINKFERLISIGKFRNYTAAGQVNFHKLTTIYGDNGGGKTTLTAVLRSLTNNDPEIIRSRISTNHTAPQAIQITCNSSAGLTHHSFGAIGWTVPVTDIDIFDIHFVSENVYSGFEFNDDHKKGLHKFVIGAQGVAIQQQIETNKSDKVTLRQEIQSLEQQIVTQTGNSLTANTLNAFIGLRQAQANNIDPQIAAANNALTTANANATIRTLPRLGQAISILPNFDFEQLINDLSSSTQSVQDAALKALFESHCEHLTNNQLQAPETWLKDGFSVVEHMTQNDELAPSCPFCKQSINSDSDIIRAYAHIFDDAFNTLVETLEQHLISFTEISTDALILAVNSICNNNDTHVTSWAVHLPNTVLAPANNIIGDENLLASNYAASLLAVQQKRQNPTTSIDTASIAAFRDQIQQINNRIDAYNLRVRTYNGGITTFLNSIQTADAAKTELDRLRRIKKRFEPAINALCTQLIAKKQRLTGLETAYTQLSQQQETTVTTFFGSYKDRVNYYLNDIFRTQFQIDDVAHVPPQGRAVQGKMGYKLVIDGKDISFLPNQPFSVKECLSEGDKTTIALAFFLSKLDIDPHRADKILVFDDPLSSLDTKRRMYTIGIIRNLVPQMKQVVILSHNEHFLYEICKDFSHADKKTLCITENFVAKASILEVCDLDELVKNDYFKQLEALEKFRIAPDHAIKDTILGWLRNVLEAHLNFKFHKALAAMPGQKTFGNQIRYLDGQGVVFRDNSNRVSIIAKMKLINSIAWKPHHGDPSPDYAALGINPNSITPSELDNLIQDTLILVENQL